jgi:DNA-binding winged helix-turn-helix (wHTH) protein
LERLSWATAPAVAQFRSEPQLDLKRPGTVAAAPTEVSFGPFRLFPTQFLLLEGDKSVPIGSRAFEILVALLQRPREVVSKQELMARVWPNIFVDPANLTVHISALRRMLRDGRDGHRFIINIPGRGYSFVASVAVAGRLESDEIENRGALRKQS